jgi:hypothetical protein
MANPSADRRLRSPLLVEAMTVEEASEIGEEADPMAIEEATRTGLTMEIVLLVVTLGTDPEDASTVEKRDT